MPLLILPPRSNPDAEAVRVAASEAGWQIEQFTSWRAPIGLRGQDLVLYGEPLFADVITPTLRLALLAPPVDWLLTLPQPYVRREARLTTLGDAMRLPDRWFIKPVEDKCFAAGVYQSGADLPITVKTLAASTAVLMSAPVIFAVEFRCFVLDRCVVALSPYARFGDLARADDGTWPASPEEQDGARIFMVAFLADADVRLPAAVVVDVGLIEGRGWAVVEANAAWGSGIYGCDPSLVLPVLRRATRNRDTLDAEDRQWLRQEFEVAAAP